MPAHYVGADVGSTTVKVVALDDARALLAHRYLRSNGRPRERLIAGIAELRRELGDFVVAGLGLTGSGGAAVAALTGGRHVNELVAQARAVGHFHPEARTVIELGGQDSKYLSLEWNAHTRQMMLVDFAMNAVCAAGTGSFLDQQAERLGISIEGEFAEIALRSTSPARVAGRCTVFAKSDMIHLQQRGVPLADILAGLCLALARNFRTVIGKGKPFTPPILFQGGVACNGAVVRAFEEVLQSGPGGVIVPEHHTIMAALGTAFVTMDGMAEEGPSDPLTLDAIEAALCAPPAMGRTLPVLQPRAAERRVTDDGTAMTPPLPVAPRPAYVGVDVGSISTNVVVLDEDDRLLARRYLATAGRPLEAVRRGLAEVGRELGHAVEIRGAGTTGSGRYLTGDFVGADVVRNEITAQARAAVACDPAVDTIFEIGGQDSKYIRLHDGAVVDFAMNNACAAGTGSFLEEQATRLRIGIREQFSDMAFCSRCPAALGERCTVFMESDLVHHQQRGARVEDLTAGLAYSIVENYLNRVVDGRAIGRRVFFQGGVASNASVAAAFEQSTGRTITVPPNHDVTGAIGAAILARETMTRRRAAAPATASRFRGFDLADRRYETTVFECRACANLCEVSRVVIAGEPPIFYGARCDRFEEAGRTTTARADLPDLFAERNALLIGDWSDPGPRRGRVRVGMPRGLAFHDMMPYWRAFFGELDVDLVLSEPTNPRIVQLTHDHATAEACFPVKLMYGHAADLLDRDVDFIFLPAVVSRSDAPPHQEHNHYCPFIPMSSHLVAARLGTISGARVLTPSLRFLSPRAIAGELRALGRELGASAAATRRAMRAGETASREFVSALRARGRAVLDVLDDRTPGVVIIGRPYNTTDTGANQDLPYKLRKLGALPIPIDLLPLESIDISDVHTDMFWRCGQDILAAARIVRDDPRLQAIYLTNFGCGPDAFLIGFFRRQMNGKPFLELEVDDHTADAGLITRCEAFLDSLGVRGDGP